MVRPPAKASSLLPSWQQHKTDSPSDPKSKDLNHKDDMTLTLDTARSIVAACRAHGRSSDLNPLTVVVLDAGGHVVAAEREDGASIKRFEIAYGKAHGALALGMGSRSLMERAEQQHYFITAATAAVGGALVPVPGGVLVRDTDGVLLGAVGVTGDTSDRDEDAAVAGIESVDLTAQPR
ncbi:GlcG/HbpS family heme-binding protein [Rhodococcus koreensis]